MTSGWSGPHKTQSRLLLDKLPRVFDSIDDHSLALVSCCTRRIHEEWLQHSRISGFYSWYSAFHIIIHAKFDVRWLLRRLVCDNHLLDGNPRPPAFMLGTDIFRAQRRGRQNWTRWCSLSTMRLQVFLHPVLLASVRMSGERRRTELGNNQVKSQHHIMLTIWLDGIAPCRDRAARGGMYSALPKRHADNVLNLDS